MHKTPFCPTSETGSDRQRALQIRAEHFRLDAIVFDLTLHGVQVLWLRHSRLEEAEGANQGPSASNFASTQIDRLGNCSVFGQSQSIYKSLAKALVL